MTEPAKPGRVLGRYAIYDEIAAGGMATVHFGRLLGPVGFSRTVAVKRLHPQFAKDPEFAAMFLDEARLAARIRHPNVVPTLDVVATEGELFLVMEYIQGESLSRLIRTARATNVTIPHRYGVAIVVAALDGLHAAHEAKSERGGEPLNIVHRDVSPQNILVGVDGIGRVLDFGVAKAIGRAQTTRDGQLKGKLSYMAPEQIRGEPVSRATDVYAATAVLWEVLTGRKLFTGDNDAHTVAKVMEGIVDPPSKYVSGLPSAVDALVLRGLQSDPAKRFSTAREMARLLQKTFPLVAPTELGEWVEQLAASTLSRRAERIADIENSSSSIQLPVASAPTAAEESGPQMPVTLAAAVVAPTESPSNPTGVTSGSSSGSRPMMEAPAPTPAPRLLQGLVAGLALAAIVAVGVVGVVRVVHRQERQAQQQPPAPAVATATTPPTPTVVATPAPTPTPEITSAAPAPSSPSSVATAKPIPQNKPTAAPAPATATAATAAAAPASSRKGVNLGSVLDSRK